MGTTEDKLEIMELMARHGLGSDSGDPIIYADVFTDDAVFNLVFRPPRGETVLKGREELIAYLSSEWQAERRSKAQLRHITGCPMFTELTPERAVTRTYCTVFSISREPGSTPTTYATGIYYDEIVRTPKGWRFKSRKFIADPPPQDQT